MYAYVVDGALVSVGRLPSELEFISVQGREAAGYFLVDTSATAPSPYPPPDGYWIWEVQLISGVWTQVCSVRPYTVEEQAAITAGANKGLVETKLGEALVALQAIIDDTNANINTNPAARIKGLARVLRHIIRHELNKFDGVD